MKPIIDLFQILNNPTTPISQLSICIDILKSYNVRCSELLSSSWELFYPEQFLVILGKKRSSNIIIRDKIILSQIDKLPRIHPTLIFPSVSYNILYHQCKTYYSHLFLKFKKRKNYKVTHGFRYQNVSQFDNDTIIRDILHHRTISSGKYYKSNKGVK
jgi:hypothetical protein